MLPRVLLALACCSSLACSSITTSTTPLPQHGPAAATSRATAPAPKPVYWKLPYSAARELLPGSAQTFFFVEREDGGIRVEELDAGTLTVVRTMRVADPGVLLTWTRSSDRIYALFAHDDAHRLVALDPVSLDLVAESVTPVAMLTGARGDPKLEPGKRGVRVVYLKHCAEDPEGLCCVYETHALGTLAVTKVRQHTWARGWSAKLPPVRVPEDQGADDSYPASAPPSWSYDFEKHALVSTDGRSVPFEIHGTLIGNFLWVGRRVFVATSGCCGGPRGGFYVREVPE